MINVLYAMEEGTLESYISFKRDIDNIRLIATPNQIDHVKKAMQELWVSSGQSFQVDEVTGDAIIDISGTLTPRPEVCVSLHDGSQTIYSTITESILNAEKMPSVKQIKFIINSPGGYVSGVDNVAVAIKNCTKPTIAVIGSMACSAAYWLASQCGKIIASTPLAQIGSIGVIVEAIDRKKADEKDGIERFILTSKNAPEKFQDIGTEKGRQKVISDLNDIETIFISRVASGRNVSANEVKSGFGQGGVLLAEEALKAGMIDEIVEDSKLTNDFTPSNSGKIKTKIKEEEPKIMANLNETLGSDPKMKAEFDNAIKKASKEASEKAVIDFNADVKARSEKVEKYLKDDSTYPKAVKDMAEEFKNGKATIETVEAMASMHDQSDEAKKAALAIAESENAGNVNSQNSDPEKISADGSVSSEAEFKEMQKRNK